MSLEERLSDLSIRMYQHTFDEDLLIADWWHAMSRTGEISQLVASNAHTLSGFYSLFKSPNMLVYTVKEEQMESAHWAEPVSTSPNAVFFSSWWEPESRGSKRP